jgi:hypothetical protein
MNDPVTKTAYDGPEGLAHLEVQLKNAWRLVPR